MSYTVVIDGTSLSLTVFTYSSGDVLYISRIPSGGATPPLREDKCSPPDLEENRTGRCRYLFRIDFGVPEPPDLDDLAILELAPDLVDHNIRNTTLSYPYGRFEILKRFTAHA
jgi:hypothetical protein